MNSNEYRVLKGLRDQALKDAEVYAPEGNEPIWAYIADAQDVLFEYEQPSHKRWLDSVIRGKES